jgi:hypothetical protein
MHTLCVYYTDPVPGGALYSCLLNHSSSSLHTYVHCACTQILSQLVPYFLGSQSLDPSGASYTTSIPIWGINMVSR